MAQPNAGGVWVSLETMYEAQQATHKEVVELRADVRAALKLERRIRALEVAEQAHASEKRPAGAVTTGAAITALLGAAGTAVWQAIGGV